VEDLEMRLAVGKEPELMDRRIEGLGLVFQISTRLTSWVAVSEEATLILRGRVKLPVSITRANAATRFRSTVASGA
jgi:hypothetical protein